MKTTGLLLISIVGAAALQNMRDDPKRGANESSLDGLKFRLLHDPESCEHHARELLAGIDGILSEEQTSRIQGILGKVEYRSKLSFLVVGTKHSVCMTDNWFVHSVNATTKPSVFVYVALDEESHSSCVHDFQSRGEWGKVKHIIECVDMSDVLPWSELKSPNVIGFGSCIYQLIVWMKPLFLKVATSSVLDPSNVLLIDTDVILHGDVHELLSEGRTWMFQTGHDDGRGNPNTGLVNINSNAEELLHLWLEQAPVVFGKDQADQYGLIRLLSSPEGRHFKEQLHLIPQSQFGMFAERGQYATHYNGVQEKDVSMAMNGVFRPATQGCMDRRAELEKKVEDFKNYQAEHQMQQRVLKWASIFDQEIEKMLQTS